MIERRAGHLTSSYDERTVELHNSLKSSPVLQLASKGPITAYPTTSVKQACATLVDNGIRRVPVVDAGTKKVIGMLSARDLIDFFGGGEKYNILKKEFNGNLFSAVNMSVSKIMSEDVVSIKESSDVESAAQKMLEKGVGGCPIVDSEGRILAIISERDFIKKMAEGNHGIATEDIMSKKVVSVPPEMSLGAAARTMIKNGFRRLPVLDGKELVGMLRTTSILRFISGSGFARFGTASAEEILAREKVEDAMSKYFVTVRPNESMEALVSLMLARRIGGFPVEKDDAIIGMVTEHDVFRAAYSKGLLGGGRA